MNRTLEELYLARGLMRGLGSDSIDHRLRHGEYRPLESVRHLGMRITDLNHVQHALVVGSMLRYDHPLFALRLRDAARRGLFAYGPDSLKMPILYLIFAVIAGVYLFMFLRSLFSAGRFLSFHKFHFLLYICTVEIAPVLILVR